MKWKGAHALPTSSGKKKEKEMFAFSKLFFIFLELKNKESNRYLDE